MVEVRHQSRLGDVRAGTTRRLRVPRPASADPHREDLAVLTADGSQSTVDTAGSRLP